MKTGLHSSSQKLLAALLIAAAMTFSTIYAPVALYSAVGLQAGAPLYMLPGAGNPQPVDYTANGHKLRFFSETVRQ